MYLQILRTQHPTVHPMVHPTGHRQERLHNEMHSTLERLCILVISSLCTWITATVLVLFCVRYLVLASAFNVEFWFVLLCVFQSCRVRSHGWWGANLFCLVFFAIFSLASLSGVALLWWFRACPSEESQLFSMFTFALAPWFVFGFNLCSPLCSSHAESISRGCFNSN